MRFGVVSEALLTVILAPVITGLIAGVGALWRRSVTQRDESIAIRTENAGLKSDLRAAHQDIGELRNLLQERILSEEYLLSYIEALEAVCRKHGIELPQRPRLRRVVQRAITPQEESING